MAISSPSTSLSLIGRARNNDSIAWERMIDVYGPVIYRWCRIRGVATSDAADISQEVFAAVWSGLDRYDRQDGQRLFRAWLYGITSHKINTLYRRLHQQPELLDASIMEETIAVTDDTEQYLRDPALMVSDQKLVLRKIVEFLRSEFSDLAWSAFTRTVIDGQKCSDIAVELNLTAANVRQMKHRVLKRLREELQGLEPN